jgi:hypothetical protein
MKEDLICKFGKKYYDEHFLTIFRKDPFYLKWMNTDHPEYEMPKKIYELLNKDIYLLSSYKMPMGRYKGKSLSYILNNDISYFKWLYSILDNYEIKLEKVFEKKFKTITEFDNEKITYTFDSFNFEE